MTAIGAMPEGLDEDEIARRVAGASPDDLRRWAADVRQWIVGPYTGATPVDELRIRAAALVDTLSGGRKASTIAGGVTVESSPTSPSGVEGPGSDTDPAFSSPSPAPGPVGLDGGDDATEQATAAETPATGDES
jgi:hypothetical protein